MSEAAAPPSSEDPGRDSDSDDQGKEASRRLWLRALVGLACGALAVIAVVHYLDISGHELGTALHGVRAAPLVFAALAGLVLLALQSLRWWVVMHPVVPLSYGHAYKAMIVGFACNVLLPARGGDLLRVQYLGRRTGLSRAKLLGTEIVDFWSDKWGWIASFPILCLFGDPPRWLLRALLLMGGLVVVGAAILFAMGSRLWRGRSAPAFLKNLRDGFAANHWRRLLFVETALAPLPWLWETLAIAVAGHALGLALTPMQAFATLTAFNLAIAVPSPANAGSFEAGGTLALVAFGIDKQSALAFLFLYHLTQVVPGLLGGLVVLVVEGEPLFGRRRRSQPRGVTLVAAPSADPAEAISAGS